MSNLPTTPVIAPADGDVEGMNSGMNAGGSDSCIGICTDNPNPKAVGDWPRIVVGATRNPIGHPQTDFQYAAEYGLNAFTGSPVGFAPADTQAAPGEVYATNVNGTGWDLKNKTHSYTTEVGDWLWGIVGGGDGPGPGPDPGPDPEPQPTCKTYQCDAYEQAVLSVINPYVYWAFDWPDGGPYPQDVTDKGSAGIDGRLTTLDVGYVGDDGYIDNCVGTLDVPAPQSTTIIANPDKVAPNFWENGISLLEDCTVGMLFNISTARGVANSPIIMSTEPGFNWAWQVRFNTASNTFSFKSLSSWPDEYFTLVADTVDLSNILWDVDGNPVWVQMVVWVSRDEALQEMNLKAYINGVSIASKSESFLADPRTNFQVDDVESNDKQLQIKGDGPFSENPSGQVYVDHVWMQVGETTPAQQQQLFSAFEQNQSGYIDHDPNCVPA